MEFNSEYGKINIEWKQKQLQGIWLFNQFYLETKFDDGSIQILADVFLNCNKEWAMKTKNYEICTYPLAKRSEAFKEAERDSNVSTLIGTFDYKLNRPKNKKN